MNLRDLSNISPLKYIEQLWDSSQRHLLTSSAAVLPIIYFGDGAYAFLTDGRYDRIPLAIGAYLCGFTIEAGAPKAFVAWFRGKPRAGWLVILWGAIASVSVFALHEYDSWHGYGLGFVVYAAPFVAYSARAYQLAEAEELADEEAAVVRKAKREAVLELMTIEGKAAADAVRTKARNDRKVADAEAEKVVETFQKVSNNFPEETQPPSQSEKVPAEVSEPRPRDFRKLRKNTRWVNEVRSLSIEEVVNIYNVTPKTAGAWKKQLGEQVSV